MFTKEKRLELLKLIKGERLLEWYFPGVEEKKVFEAEFDEKDLRPAEIAIIRALGGHLEDIE